MTRYYLHFHYSDTFFQDDEGDEFGSLHDAELDAIASIHDLAINYPRNDRAPDLLSICITNTESEVLAVLLSRKVLAAPRPQIKPIRSMESASRRISSCGWAPAGPTTFATERLAGLDCRFLIEKWPLNHTVFAPERYEH